MVLGLAFYGRSFTLKNPSCNKPGCEFLSGGEAGACTGTSGVLSNAEIYSIIAKNSLTPVFEKAAMVKYITWGGNQWVSFEDKETLTLKKQWANNHCLGGVMIWALSQDTPDYQSLFGLSSAIAGVDPQSSLSIQVQLRKSRAVEAQNKAGVVSMARDSLRDFP